MSKFLKIFLVFIGVWATASIFNGLLSGVCIGISDKYDTEVGGDIMAAIICSFFFSVPFVGLTWLITCIAQSMNKTGFALFQIVLATTIICSSIGAVFFINTLGREFSDCRYAVGICIIISAVLSVLVFRTKIKTEG